MTARKQPAAAPDADAEAAVEAPAAAPRVRPGRKPSLLAPAGIAYEKAKARHEAAVARLARVNIADLQKDVEVTQTALEDAEKALSEALAAVTGG